jgi:hypothetical protein
VSKTEYPFPEDEFDQAGRGRVPEGVHRTPTPRWRVLLPFLIVLLVAPVLAYAGVNYLAGLGSETVGPGASASPSSEVVGQAPAGQGRTEEPGATQEGSPEPEATPEPTPEPTPEAPVVARDVPVLALNGTTTPGLAAAAAARLQGDGFTSINVGNARSRVPSVSTVYYHDATMKESAERVAALLGVGQVVEMASATQHIAVVLRRDVAL